MTLDRHPAADPEVLAALDELQANLVWIDEQTRGLKLPGDPQRQCAYACLDVSLEHMAGILFLARAELYGPMLALARVQFDAFIRGAWLGRVAKPEQFERFARGSGPDGTLAEITKAVQDKIGPERSTLTDFFETSKKALHAFTHTGMHQVTRRLGNGTVGANYSAEDISRAARLALALGVLAACEMATFAGSESVARATLELAKRKMQNNPPAQ